MASKFYLAGICPVCGQTHTDVNPALSFNVDSQVADRDRARKAKHPVSFWKCYHNGTPFHDSGNFNASSGCKVPMHLFYRDGKHRVYPTAGDA